MPPSKGANSAPTTADSWEEIQPFTQPIEMEIGDEIIANYLGGNLVDVPGMDDDGNPEIRPTMLHEFQEDSAEEPFGVWGSAMLDKRLSSVEVGNRVKIRYDGKRDIPGGRTARQYRVWISR